MKASPSPCLSHRRLEWKVIQSVLVGPDDQSDQRQEKRDRGNRCNPEQDCHASAHAVILRPSHLCRCDDPPNGDDERDADNDGCLRGNAREAGQRGLRGVFAHAIILAATGSGPLFWRASGGLNRRFAMRYHCRIVMRFCLTSTHAARSMSGCQTTLPRHRPRQLADRRQIPLLRLRQIREAGHRHHHHRVPDRLRDHRHRGPLRHRARDRRRQQNIRRPFLHSLKNCPMNS